MCGDILKANVKIYIYVIVLVLFAAVIWIKYDYDEANNSTNNSEDDLFMEFLNDNNIKDSTFSCYAKNDTIIYLDDKYLLTNTGELYEVKYDSTFENGHNCRKIDSNIKFSYFYDNNKLIYDHEHNFYDITKNFEPYESNVLEYYLMDLDNLEEVNKKYPYIYFYDVEAKELELDNFSSSSNKLLIDNRGNINIYTNYGYPSSLNLLQSEDTEIIFNRVDYMGVILSIFRSDKNQVLKGDSIDYLKVSEEVPNELYGLRIITTKGMYNEVVDDKCKDKICSTKLVMDKEFSKYFDNIVYSNGKYIFIKDTLTKIYNIESYVSTY